MVSQRETVQACLPLSVDTERLPETVWPEFHTQEATGSSPVSPTIF